eukprot:3428881-Rhodomonas_salina.1
MKTPAPSPTTATKPTTTPAIIPVLDDPPPSLLSLLSELLPSKSERYGSRPSISCTAPHGQIRWESSERRPALRRAAISPAVWEPVTTR